ncbi:MAG: peptide-methionine (R)-S-oxide reductase MsrB [Alphaproteobacteria bacterium]|nr:peptide-methionine (R)-S-oxide reductase MsrB [Alphaproteobacteria bacterium]
MSKTDPRTASRKTDAEWKAELSPEAYQITRCGATERAFTGPHLTNKAAGAYACVCCGQPLFSSETKYESGSGWPSFTAPAGKDAVAERVDTSHGMSRTEVLCAHCEAHLGHVFPDGPRPTGLRYCINGHALAFRPKDEA